MKVFDGGSLVGGDVKVGVSSLHSTPSQATSANKMAAKNNVFHAGPMPTSLKKMSNANQSLERYLQRTNNNAKSDRTILTKHSSEQQNNHSAVDHSGSGGNFKTLNNCASEDAAAGLQFQSLESVSVTGHNEEMQMQ